MIFLNSKLAGKLTLWLSLVLAVFVLPASAAERILLFDSTIKVAEDGSMLVKEIIRVKAEGRSIRRGIYRDFPIRYRGEGGYRRYVSFKVTSITRDGKAEPYFQRGSGDHTRTYIGAKEIYLAHGEYQYEIVYKTNRQLRYFKDFDELYWNVTGNKWAFPIDKVIARVELPEAAKIINSAAFTGRYGENSGNFTIRSVGQNAMIFETTKPLGFYEGFTFAVGWPKGVVPVPSPLVSWLWRIWDNLGFALLLAGTLGVAAYFYIVWRWVGRDPERDAIFPQFSPPADLSPASVSYLHYMGFRRASSGSSKPFIAALVSLAVKGVISIDDSGDDVKIIKARKPAKSELPPGEKAMFKKLLGSRDELTFKQSNHHRVQPARAKFKSALLKEHGALFFNNNYGWFGLGLLASVLVFSGSMFLIQEEDIVVVVAGLTIMSVVGSFILSLGFRRMANWIPGADSIFIDTFFIVVGVAVLVAMVVLTLIVEGMPPWLPYCGMALGAMNILFVHLMRAPTILGQQMMVSIEGFKLYLTVAEAERMNMNNAPDVTEEIFEKFLPYAIGLGVEKPWSNAFETHLAKTVPSSSNQTAYRPRWYSGSSGWDSSRMAATTAGIVGAVSAGVATASPPSSSGSSGGGGGFSGGGGGGGGGGGW